MWLLQCVKLTAYINFVVYTHSLHKAGSTDKQTHVYKQVHKNTQNTQHKVHSTHINCALSKEREHYTTNQQTELNETQKFAQCLQITHIQKKKIIDFFHCFSRDQRFLLNRHYCANVLRLAIPRQIFLKLWILPKAETVLFIQNENTYSFWC